MLKHVAYPQAKDRLIQNKLSKLCSSNVEQSTIASQRYHQFLTIQLQAISALLTSDYMLP